MPTNDDRLDPALLVRILDRLGLDSAPRPTPAGLAWTYAAWSRTVPFDNVRKLIRVEAGDPGPLPGDRPEEFFDAWLRWGSGGTC